MYIVLPIHYYSPPQSCFEPIEPASTHLSTTLQKILALFLMVLQKQVLSKWVSGKFALKLKKEKKRSCRLLACCLRDLRVELLLLTPCSTLSRASGNAIGGCCGQDILALERVLQLDKVTTEVSILLHAFSSLRLQ